MNNVAPVVREVGDDARLHVITYQGYPVVLAHLVQEQVGGVEIVIEETAQAGIGFHQQYGGQRRFGGGKRDHLLLLSVQVDAEVLPTQPGDDVAFPVHHGHVHVDQRHIHAQGVGLFRLLLLLGPDGPLALLAGWRLLRARRQVEAETQQEQQQKSQRFRLCDFHCLRLPRCILPRSTGRVNPYGKMKPADPPRTRLPASP